MILTELPAENATITDVSEGGSCGLKLEIVVVSRY
jgi:hypothetical protein